jgi:hypothetical protein
MTEVRDLLKEVRDLLVPVSGAHRDEYDRWLVAEGRRAEVRAQLSTPKRRNAWDLSDGTRSQRQIAQAAGMDEGGASRFFRSLREIRALTDATNPTRAMELE